MSMYDSLKVINISNKKFKHNGADFQTLDLESKMSDYLIFNNQLWLQYDGAESIMLDEAIPVDFTGAIQIYTEYKSGDKLSWVEYKLEFKLGKLTGVNKIYDDVVKDYSDKSNLRPTPKTESPCVTIDFRGTGSEVYEKFMDKIDSNVNKIREVIGEPMTELVYQVRPTREDHLVSTLFTGSPRWVHNVVQSFGAMKQKGNDEKERSMELSNGDKIHVIFDEASEYFKG